jgi:hypothetical protein
VRRAFDQVPGDATTLVATALGLGTAAAAGLGAPTEVWIALALLAVVFAGIGLTRWLEDRAGGDSLRAAAQDSPDRATSLVGLVQAELVAIVDDGHALRPVLPFGDPDVGAYTIWCEATRRFVARVLGAVERQRFDQPGDPPGVGLSGSLSDRLDRLADLRDRPDTWELQVDADDLDTAITERRTISLADRIVMATSGPSFDRTEVARALYRSGSKLLRQLPWLGGAPTTREEAAEGERLKREKVVEWAWEAFKILEEHFPGQERKFAPGVRGDLDLVEFRWAADDEIDGRMPETYLEERLRFLADLIERREGGG